MFPLRVIVQVRRYHNDEPASKFPEPNLYPINEHQSFRNIKIEQSSEKPQASCRPSSPHPKPFLFYQVFESRMICDFLNKLAMEPCLSPPNKSALKYSFLPARMIL